MEFQAGRAAEAEVLLRHAIAQEPNSPNLLNNLASALEMQGRRGESRALMIEIHERFPDYFFGRTNVAASLSRMATWNERGSFSRRR